MNTGGPLHLPDNLYPLESYLNRAIGPHFLDALRLAASGSSLGFDYTGWCTYGELDDFEKSQTPPFAGILVWAGPGVGDEVVVSSEAFVEHLRLAGEAHVQLRPRDRTEVESLIAEISLELPVRAGSF